MMEWPEEILRRYYANCGCKGDQYGRPPDCETCESQPEALAQLKKMRKKLALFESYQPKIEEKPADPEHEFFNVDGETVTNAPGATYAASSIVRFEEQAAPPPKEGTELHETLKKKGLLDPVKGLFKKGNPYQVIEFAEGKRSIDDATPEEWDAASKAVTDKLVKCWRCDGCGNEVAWAENNHGFSETCITCEGTGYISNSK